LLFERFLRTLDIMHEHKALNDCGAQRQNDKEQ